MKSGAITNINKHRYHALDPAKRFRKHVANAARYPCLEFNQGLTPRTPPLSQKYMFPLMPMLFC